MKILTLNYEFPPIGGGAAPVALHLCRYLAALGHSVDVVTMRYKGLPRRETMEGVEVYRTPAFRARPDLCRIHEMASYLLGARPAVRRLLKQKQYDIVHTHFLIPTGLLGVPAARQAGCPLVVTIHGSDIPGYNPDRFRLAHRLLLPVWKRLARRVDQLVSPSGHLKALAEKHCPDVRVKIIPNGFEVNRFDAGAVKKPRILACSRLLPRKGFQYLIEAVQEPLAGWEVEIVGDGPFLPALKQQAESSRTPVHFHGWLNRDDPEFKQLYESSAIFVFPSEAENFPTVLLEALAAGCAVITSDAGGCPEVTGPAAVYVKPRDSRGLREALEKLIANEPLRRDLSQKARQQIERFSWPGIARQYADLFAQMKNAASMSAKESSLP